MWDELGIDPCDDPKAIRRAYAVRLKRLDPDRDLHAFTRLREALEWALAQAEDGAPSSPPGRARPPLQPDAGQGPAGAFDLPSARTRSDDPASDGRPVSGRPAAQNGVPAVPEWFQSAAADRALLDALDTALGRRDAAEAVKLYHRAAATGAVRLQAAPSLLDRVFAVLIEDKTVGGATFREFARTFGWDKPARDLSEPRRRVLARLAAEDWYGSLLALADGRGRAKRKPAKLARLMLGRIGRHWMPRVDRAALKRHLDAYRTHETWLRDRIDPAWARALETRWRRREIAVNAFFALFLAAMLINGVRVFVMEAVAGTLSIGLSVIGLCSAAFLLWPLKRLVTEILRLAQPSSSVSGSEHADDPTSRVSGPEHPDNPEARLRWLEQQAELAYEAMYDAPPGAALAGRYNDVKEFLHDAIALAHRLGYAATAERLSKRLAEIKAVFRSQFSA
jgi:hypothetical protein